MLKTDAFVYIENIFCSPIYIMKLYKLVSHIIAARDIGSVKAITRQPLKGRSNDGGSHIGQMEIKSGLLLIVILAKKL